MSGHGVAAYPVVVAAMPPAGRTVPVTGDPALDRLREAMVPVRGAGLAPTGFELLGGSAGVREAVRRWLRLVEADGGLAPYLVGVDVARLAGHLALLLTTALGGPAGNIARPVVGAWRGLGLTEAHHRRVVDYLTGVLWAMDLPAGAIATVGRAFAGEAGR